MWLVPILQLMILTSTFINAVKPPGYVETKKPEEEDPPKYSYKYNIADEKGQGEHGKEERRDGIHAAGRYYVQDKEYNHDVRYFADDWGYHPAVEYSAKSGPHGRSRTRFALGHEAVQQLRNKENNRPQLQGLPDIGRLKEESDKDAEPTNQQQDLRDQYTDPSPINLQDVPRQKLIPLTLDASNSQEVAPTIQQVPIPDPQISTVSQPTTGQIIINQQIQPQHQNEIIQPATRVVVPQPEQVIVQQASPQPEITQQTILYPQQPDGVVEQVVVNNQGTLPQPEGSVQTILINQQPEVEQKIIQQNEIAEQPQTRLIVNQIAPQEHQQNVILQTETAPQQNVFLVPQQGISNPHILLLQPQLISPQTVPIQEHNTLFNNQYGESAITPLKTVPQVTDNSLESKQLETAALFESSVKSAQLSQHLIENDFADAEQSFIKSFKKFGMKIDGKNDHRNRLIESTKDLINGQDVLSINDAATIENEAENLESKTIAVTATTISPTEVSLKEQPIIVADSEDIIASTTPQYEVKEKEEEQHQSTIQTTDKIEITNTVYETSPYSTIVVTPRPVSTKFLAPITAGIRLEHSETEDRNNKVQVEVDIQKSVPYYLGKYEFPLEFIQQNGLANTSSIEAKATEDIELGKSLLIYPGQTLPVAEKLIQQLPDINSKQQFAEVNNHLSVQHLPQPTIQTTFAAIDQEIAQGFQHQVAVQHLKAVQDNKQEKVTVISEPYPVKVPYGVPYPVVKQVQVPVTVEKIVEKPVTVTKYIEKPIAVPQPYPVERIVERPIHVPVHVTQYVDRPYPVEVRVPFPQPYPVEKVIQKIVKQPYPVEVKVPYPVERIVEKKVPVPQYIEKRIPVEKIVEKPVPHYIDRPYPVEVRIPVPKPVPVEKIVERPVPHYIDRPFPVEVKVPVPRPVEKIIEKPVPQYIDRPVPVQVPVHIPHPVVVEKPIQVPHPVPVEVKVPVSFQANGYRPVVPFAGITSDNVQIDHVFGKHGQQFIGGSAAFHQKLTGHPQVIFANVPIQQNIPVHYQQPVNQEHFAQQSHQTFFYINPYAYAPQANQYLPPKRGLLPPNNGYLPPASINNYLPPPPIKSDCGDSETGASSRVKAYHDNYIGLLPPKYTDNHLHLVQKYRSARSNFNDKNIRLEYGFKPPMVPSLEIDEQGNPIEKDEK